MRFNKYTKEQFIEAVKTSLSYREVLQKLDIIAAGGNYATLRKYIKELNLDTGHMTGQLWNKGKKIGPKRPIEDYLSNKQTIHSYKLKQRLISENIKEHKCELCNNNEWFDKPIPLELHHIDGNNLNNSLTNLQILCPNCHSTTENYRGKNKESYKKNINASKQIIRKIKRSILCPKCNSTMNNRSKICKSCYKQKHKIQWPSIEFILSELKTKSYLQLARDLNISDWAIRKHLIQNGIKPPQKHISKVGLEPTMT